MSNYSMLKLFAQESGEQLTILQKQLKLLRDQVASDSILDSLIQPLQKVYGMAHLVEREAIIELTQGLENSLASFLNQEHRFTIQQLDLLSQAADLLLRMTQVEEENWPDWLSAEIWDFSTIKQALTSLTGDPTMIPNVRIVEQTSLVEEINPPAPVEKTSLVDNTLPPDPKEERSLVVDSFSPALTEQFSPDNSMLDLFRLEVEAQLNILNTGLLSLESNPTSAQDLEALMRAAHSIKGAARIVGLNTIVNLAHIMEDCFVAAQNQKLLIKPEQIDLLLQGIDQISVVSQLEPAQLPQWLQAHQTQINFTQESIRSILQPTTSTVITRPAEEPSPTPVEEAPSNIINQNNQDRVVRVSADNLNRIMGLAGESLIAANWLEPFTGSLVLLKTRQFELAKLLENFQDYLATRNKDRYLMQLLSELAKKEQQCREILGERIQELEQYGRRVTGLSDRLYNEVIATNMRPFNDGVQGFPRMLRDLARQLNKQVNLEIVGKATPVDRDILKKLEAPLTHILRNALDHGLESPEERIALGKPPQGTIRLEASHRGGMLSLNISDDGRGIDLKKLRMKVIDRGLSSSEVAEQLTDSELIEFLFLPGFSTAKQVTEISGRGVGLDIAKSMAQEVGGIVRASTTLGKGTSFYFQLPLTLSVVRTLLVEISGEVYAFPLARIDQIVMLEQSDISMVEGRQYFTIDQKNIGLIPAHQVLGFPENTEESETLAVVIISDQANCYGVVVDRFLGERDLVVRPLDVRLGRVQDISALALNEDGSPILIIDVSDLVNSINFLLDSRRLITIDVKSKESREGSAKSILVVDDSITVREMERKLLEHRGYRVDIAVDGLEGWNAVRTNSYDLIITDVDMPRMNGIELIKNIRNHSQLSSLPVIVVSYRDRQEDRIQGLDSGANYYLTKTSFEDDTLIQAVIDLVGV
jgi:two-component system sensor histidine kinase and response regulator WspE